MSADKQEVIQRYLSAMHALQQEAGTPQGEALLQAMRRELQRVCGLMSSQASDREIEFSAQTAASLYQDFLTQSQRPSQYQEPG